MTLRITDRGATVTCPKCNGLGRVRCPDTFASTGDKTRSSQHPIPCPLCFGTKQVAAGPLPHGEKRDITPGA